ncbi:MAG: hypothetical protein I3273_00900 [Candidatus Moeniiplasma glomeromycotorum]|nr:hypothetical protein [Candidatus Moeniiplasma glomeromycotorum]MCE8167318.1 hypothetical protein [Candidatus Moeniiplasma glomeromycotorum]MCE8168668.1 hypothetical protein [Candidatus Moeniiplasma glomeromycotorum]
MESVISVKEKSKETCACNCSKLVVKKCPHGVNHCFLVRDGKEYLLTKQIIEKVREILSSSQDIYERKIALFDFLESLDVGDLPTVKKRRIDYLLQGRLYNELAKKSMEEYRKSTISDFSNNN